MISGILHFEKMPEIGFAHHLSIDGRYTATFPTTKASKNPHLSRKSFELVYIKKGALFLKYNNQVYEASTGSFMLIPRHMHLQIFTNGNSYHSHCTMQFITDYTFELTQDTAHTEFENQGLVLPLILPPSNETDVLKIELYAAVSAINLSREANQMHSAIAGLNIIRKLSSCYKASIFRGNSSSLLEHQIKSYISQNLRKKISISDIAMQLHKTPTYLCNVFKNECGSSIIQYINKQKVSLICEMLQNPTVDFQTACENVAISDPNYGYRLFKKHMGITPSEYIRIID